MFTLQNNIIERIDVLTSVEFRNDPMFLRNQFENEGTFEMPKIKKEEIDLENIELVGYDKLNSSDDNQIVHFFLDDYKFEVMWKDPAPRIEKLKSHKAVLSPNFSIYTEMPVAMKIYNTFRSRWCGAYLQTNGVKVIPTLAWGVPETFWFCFDGIEQNSIVAVSTLGVRTEKDLFMQGYNEMLRRLKPLQIICYGKSFEEMKGNVIEVDYAKTNNLDKNNSDKNLYIKHFSGYIVPYDSKGMGSAGVSNTPTWTPKKPEDKRLVGKPGEIKESFNRKGDKYLTKIGKNGYAIKERHFSNHGNGSKHSNPHDHKIDWSNNFPSLGSPINYGNEIPEFKKYGDDLMKNDNIIDCTPFDSIEDFKFSLIYGREIEFRWNNVDYGVFHEGEGKEAFFFCEANKDNEGTYFETIDELLKFTIQGQALKEIITQVEVCWRNI